MSWRFIDTHCHFDFPPFTGDESASIQRAFAAGVEKIIVPATQAIHFPPRAGAGSAFLITLCCPGIASHSD
ncbi:Putative deoxyribonuclease YjjV [Salmonella bongori]|nr:Putative deoxyribonuclease YjjV [Salmonella bongori]